MMDSKAFHPERSKTPDFLNALWRQRLAAGLFLLGVLGYVVVYNILAKPVYEAQAKIVFEQSREPISTLNVTGNVSGQTTNIINQIEEIKTFSLAQEVARALAPEMADTLVREWIPGSRPALFASSDAKIDFLASSIMGSLSAAPVRESDVIAIKAQAPTPGAARALANAAAEVMTQRSKALKREQASSTRKLIAEQLPTVAAELKKNDEDLMAFKAQNQVVSLSDEASALLTRSSAVETEHATARVDRQAAEQRLASIQDQMNSQRANVVPSITHTTSVWADSLRRVLVSQEVGYANLLVKGYDRDHPQMKKLASEIERTKQGLTSEVLRVAKGENLIDPMSRIAGLATEALTLEIDIQTDSTREAGLGSILRGYDRQMEKLPNKELQLARLTRSQEVSDNIYRMLLEKNEEARISEAGQIGDLRIIDPARLPGSPVKPKKLLNLLIALFVGGLGAGFLAVFLESLDKSLKTPQEVEEVLGVPLVGMIPEIQDESPGKDKKSRRRSEGEGVAPSQPPDSQPSRHSDSVGGDEGVASIARRLVTQYVPRSPIAEAYRTLRTNLSFADLETPLKTLVVTSAIAKEGKSTTVANLAITLAQMGVETLLMDTDLRRPVLDDLFSVKKSPGLTDVLTGKVSLESAVQKTEVEQLSILSTGVLPPNPSELLGSQKMGDLVALVKARYGMVLFDSPPVVAVTDSAVLSRWADAVLFVVRMGRTDRDLARRGKDLLDNVRAKVVGVVMNDVRFEAGYVGYQYYYYYHYYGTEEGQQRPKKQI